MASGHCFWQKYGKQLRIGFEPCRAESRRTAIRIGSEDGTVPVPVDGGDGDWPNATGAWAGKSA